MQVFGIHIPTKVIIGRGTIEQLKEVVPQYGRKALLLTTGEDLEKVGTLDRALNYLKEARIQVVVENTIEPNLFLLILPSSSIISEPNVFTTTSFA